MDIQVQPLDIIIIIINQQLAAANKKYEQLLYYNCKCIGLKLFFGAIVQQCFLGYLIDRQSI
jgi:uncharacterized membrane protein